MKKNTTKKSYIICFLAIILIFSVISSTVIFLRTKNTRTNVSEILLDAVSAIAFDMKSEKILYEKEANKQVSPGSITKLVSLFVVFDKIKSGGLSLSEMVKVSENACSAVASKVGLMPGEKMTVENLIKCVLIASGSDAMLALSEHIAGNEEKFVKLMNEKVTELGLKNTHFAGCLGLEDPYTYSSAYDIALISSEITKTYPQIYEYTKLSSTDIIRENNSVLSISSTNDMLNKPGINGLKTGSTYESGYNLAMTYNKSGKSIVFVVLNCKTLYFRRQDCIQLLNTFA